MCRRPKDPRLRALLSRLLYRALTERGRLLEVRALADRLAAHLGGHCVLLVTGARVGLLTPDDMEDPAEVLRRVEEVLR